MYPRFLVIGAQKAGTTWLHKNLKSHPEIWLPPEKEIHFFDFPPLIPFFFLLFAPDSGIRHWGLNRMKRDYRKVRSGEQSLSWYLSYYLQIRTRKWYFSLFTPESTQIPGETTPRYAPLSESKIAQVHELLPDIKIIYLLRNPIERAWSDLAMYHSPRFGKAGLETTDQQQILNFLRNSQHLASSKYFDILMRWEKHYPAARIFVGFQQQIIDAPDQLLIDIYRFLEVDDGEQHLPETIHKRVNSHSYPDIPDTMIHLLGGLLMDDLEAMHHRFNNRYTKQWLAYARQCSSP
ncbi:MAG: sulfotransferase [Gammaproteobacteria bacterium]|nr:sulfotransferase [Gammaproteobacteria bacterium]